MSDDDLQQRAYALYPCSALMRKRWIAAILYLRAGRGWVADQVSPADLKAAKEAADLRTEEKPRFADRVVTPIKRRT